MLSTITSCSGMTNEPLLILKTCDRLRVRVCASASERLDARSLRESQRPYETFLSSAHSHPKRVGEGSSRHHCHTRTWGS
eukprot:3010977-Prymnesium_polylepis.1